ncbi:AAA domain-containing protein [Actinomadura chibensis]|uniref:AAA family ATPase n=1 Tax=Actinomadura chibensis TaxID=392828 RepID=A0A5D0NEE4_9ACTN|nr:AAA domain-containing protein [Actinomadura chibensis]TYB42693.1 AAA family ATPase [Actinomadura chibensis]
MSGDTLTRERIGHLYDYLGALAQEIYAKPVRHVGDHDMVVSPDELPSHDGVRIGAAAGDAWLRVGKVPKPLPPGLPAGLREPFRDVVRDDPHTPPEAPADLARRLGGPAENDAAENDAAEGEAAEDDAAERIRAAFDRWVADVWTPWAEAAREAVAARRLYETLFRLRQRMRTDEATHELVWGHGVLGWKTGGQRVCHRLLITRARIAFDERTGEIAIVPDGMPALELDCVQGLGVPGLDRLNTVVEEVRDHPVDPWAQDEARPLYRRILAPLGLDDRLDEGPGLPEAGPAPVMAATWRLFVRRRRVMFLRFFEQLKASVANGARPPAPMVALAAGEDAARDVLAAGEADWAPVAERLLLPLAANDEQEQIARKLARHSGVTVQGPPGTGKSHTIANLVSHLVAHGKRVLVTAHKDQALAVLREKIPAELRDLSLAVLGSSSADLTELQRSVQAITAAADGVDEEREERATAALRERLDVVEGEVALLRKRLRESLERERERLEIGGFERSAAEVAEWLAEHQSTLDRVPDPLTTEAACPLNGSELTELFSLAAAIGRDDAVAATMDLPPAGRLPASAEIAARRDELRRLGEVLAGLAERGADLARVDGVPQEELAALADQCGHAARSLDRLTEPWLERLREQVVQNPQWHVLWAEHTRRLVEDITECARLRTRIAGSAVELPPAPYREALGLLEQARARFTQGKRVSGLVQRGLAQFLNGTSLDGETPRTAADIDKIIAFVELRRRRETIARLWHDEFTAALGAPPGNIPIPPGGGAHVQQGGAPLPQGGTLVQQGDAPALPGGAHFKPGGEPLPQGGTPVQQGGAPALPGNTPIPPGGAHVPQGGAPVPVGGGSVASGGVSVSAGGGGLPGEAVEIWVDAEVQRVRAALAWETDQWPRLRSQLARVIAAEAVPTRPTPADLHRLTAVLGGLETRARERHLRAELDSLARYLAEGRERDGAGPLWTDLTTALERGDYEAWDAALATAARLTALRPQVARLADLRDRLTAVAPRWARRIVETGGDTGACGDPAQSDGLWRWRQAETWVRAIIDADDLGQVQRRLDAAQEERRRLTLELTRRSAWLAMKRRLGHTERQALVGWLQTLRKIGKGTGVNANKWRAEAQRLMPEAMGAVPVWIMPYYRVAESFDPGAAPPFDVVIVDESSQCDVFAIGLLGLGRKVVVVGDDKQISPSAVGVRRDRVDELIRTHLPSFPNALLLDMESSLYDASARLFPGVVRLREHFRCLPRIIEFSSQHYYGGEIQPLREESADRLPGPAVRAVYVPDGVRRDTAQGNVNEAEADALVDQVVQCCADPAYDGRSMGVISLLGTSRQAQLIDERLLAKLGPEEYERRLLRCGDSYGFQGDERDVVFISVVSDGVGAPFTSRRYEQRINVAASRARDQMWVFHSVQPHRLHPEDQRAKLIRYAADGQRSADLAHDLEARCDSDFERRVLRMLLARGYMVTPQHPVGNLRIDLVVRGGHNLASKLAIECDGDKFHGPDQWEDDLRRQTVLERLGWRFWRVRGSAFYRDPEAATSALWPLLESLGITPEDAPENTGQSPLNLEPATFRPDLDPDAEITAKTFIPDGI